MSLAKDVQERGFEADAGHMSLGCATISTEDASVLINDLQTLPDDLPVPADDGACDHLLGSALPKVALPSTDGTDVDLSRLSGLTIVFIYPRTGVPGLPALVDDWNEIPGARGCTPQACGYRDLASSFEESGCQVFGLSTQTTAYQQEMVERLHLPFSVLSDAGLELTKTMRLPTFEKVGNVLLKRMAWVVDDGRIVKLFYPAFPPDKNAGEVLAWLHSAYNH